MPRALAYLDASALVKLVAFEPESEALAAFVEGWAVTSSRVSQVEVVRAVRRSGLDALVARAEQVLAAVSYIEVDAELARTAATVEPAALRSLDAIHLASALALGTDLGPFVTYDRRLGEAASSAELETVAPGEAR